MIFEELNLNMNVGSKNKSKGIPEYRWLLLILSRNCPEYLKCQF